MIPEFIRFYNYSVSTALSEYAVTFFSLVNSMYRLQAKESLDAIMAVSVGMAGQEGKSTIDNLNKQKRGINGIVEEVRVARMAMETSNE